MSFHSQQLEQGMRQNMVMGTSMQLFLRTLQATQTELAQIATQALSSNPALEEEPPPVQEDEPDSTPDFEAARHHDYVMETLPQRKTLGEHLEEQVMQSALPRVLEKDALALIARLDTHGFFAESPDDLAHHRFPQAARSLGVSEHALSTAVHRISRLNPDPGSYFSTVEQPIGSPDVLVERQGSELSVTLTGEMVPRLTLSAQYREMLAEHGDKVELRRYLSQCFREGRELIVETKRFLFPRACLPASPAHGRNCC